MAERATANLPSPAFPATEAFYRQLGFQTGFRDEGWMTLSRGPLELEFFRFPNVDPLTSWFKTESAPRMVAVIDEDGSLLRVIDNRDVGEEV